MNQFNHIANCHTAFGQATLTIPGTNISIPLSNTNTMSNVTTSQPGQAAVQQATTSGGQPQSHTATSTVSATTTTTTAQQSQQQANHHPATLTIPGTNIQIPTSIANGIIPQLQNVKVEGAGKLFSEEFNYFSSFFTIFKKSINHR